LVDEAAGHEARADQAHADQSPVLLPLAEEGVDGDHACTPARNAAALPSWSNAGHPASLSETALTGTGQDTPNAGSS
jgi:hypothetical protein